MSHSHVTRAHRRVLAVDARHYLTCARNALYELRYVKRSQCYYLHVTNSASVMLDAAAASAIYDALKRHLVRTIATDARATSVRTSVYTMRSDIRALLRAAECSKYAH